MGMTADELVKRPAYEYTDDEKNRDGMFYEALMEEIRFHYANNPMYRQFCINKDFDPDSFSGAVEEIPPVQVGTFKELGRELSSVPKDNIKITLQSSATSGTPSSVVLDSVTSKRQARAMVRVIGDYIGNERKPFLIMDVDPAEGFREILGARYAAVSGYLNFASEAGYFLKVGPDRKYYFDINGIKDFVSMHDSESVVVFGFTYILYSEVLRPLTDSGVKIKLPAGSKIIHIGGWKKLESEKIEKEEFNSLAAGVFGVDASDVIDIYGFTEQMGLNYPDCPCGYKHAPLYSEVIVRDIISKKPVQDGEEGLLEFLTPVPHSYPGNAVLTDDIGVIVPGECKCGRPGRRFKVIGRLKKAEVRGCGDILSSKLDFGEMTDNKAGQKSPSRFKYYYEGCDIEDSDDPQVILKKLDDALRSRSDWLCDQPVDALIGLIAMARDSWKTRADIFSDAQSQGLQFLISWCSPENLTRIANAGLRGNRRYSDGFDVSDDSPVHLLRAVPRGLVVHFLAGNVQVLGMFVLIQSIMTKNVNLLRVSSRDNGSFEALLSAFKDLEYETPGGYRIAGNDLLKTVALVSYDRSDRKIGEKISQLADVRIAWGGRDAVSAISSYPSQYDCTDIVMGPKLSMSVVAKSAIPDDRKAKKLARKIAIDASVFDQTGCASTHNVFVENGGSISPEEFAGYLAEGMSKVAIQLKKGEMTPEEFAAVHSIRGVFDFKGKVFGDDDSVWTVLYENKAELNSPVYSRVVFVHPVDSILDAAEFVTNDIQTIGLAAETKEAAAFADKAARRGAVRFPVCGRMLNFESPWDGMFVMDRMVRWVTLGGPIV